MVNKEKYLIGLGDLINWSENYTQGSRYVFLSANRITEYVDYQDQEIERLNDILNELEKCLDKDVELNYYKNGVRQYNKTLTEGGIMYRDYIKEYLKELRENK